MNKQMFGHLDNLCARDLLEIGGHMPSDDHIAIFGWSQCLPGVAAIFVERRTRRDEWFLVDIKRTALWARKGSTL